jgi:hypothetical protein
MTQSISTVSHSWLGTSDAVLRGLNHEFSNRLSLARLAPQLSAMLASGEPEMQKIAADIGRSEDMLHLLGLYRLMVFDAREPAEPLLVADVVGAAVDLFNHHTTFRDLEVQVRAEEALPPVLISRPVLLLLCAPARQVSADPGEIGAIALGFSASADDVLITARATDPERYVSTDDVPELPALGYLLRDADGAVERNGDGFTMTVGTLVRLRRREKPG